MTRGGSLSSALPLVVPYPPFCFLAPHSRRVLRASVLQAIIGAIAGFGLLSPAKIRRERLCLLNSPASWWGVRGPTLSWPSSARWYLLLPLRRDKLPSVLPFDERRSPLKYFASCRTLLSLFFPCTPRSRRILYAYVLQTSSLLPMTKIRRERPFKSELPHSVVELFFLILFSFSIAS